MTEEVTVRRDDLALVLGPDPQGIRQAEKESAYNRLTAVLAQPQPTLRDALARALCPHAETANSEWLIGHSVHHVSDADRILPVVGAAVSAAADEAWNAGAIAAAHSIDPGYLSAMSYERVMSAIWSIRRPTEGSAP